MVEIIYDKAMMSYARTRLYECAEYYYSRTDGVSYGSNTMKHHLLREGALIHKQVSCSYPISDQQASNEIEQHIEEVARQQPIAAKILRCFYNPTSLKAKRKELKKLKLDLTPEQFNHYVDLVHFWLAGRLTPKVASLNGHLLEAA
jgi:hypothetical protein